MKVATVSTFSIVFYSLSTTIKLQSPHVKITAFVQTDIRMSFHMLRGCNIRRSCQACTIHHLFTLLGRTKNLIKLQAENGWMYLREYTWLERWFRYFICAKCASQSETIHQRYESMYRKNEKLNWDECIVCRVVRYIQNTRRRVTQRIIHNMIWVVQHIVAADKSFITAWYLFIDWLEFSY